MQLEGRREGRSARGDKRAKLESPVGTNRFTSTLDNLKREKCGQIISHIYVALIAWRTVFKRWMKSNITLQVLDDPTLKVYHFKWYIIVVVVDILSLLIE